VPKEQTKLINSPKKFLKIDEFQIGEIVGKQENFSHYTPRKQSYSSKQLPSLSVIKGLN